MISRSVCNRTYNKSNVGQNIFRVWSPRVVNTGWRTVERLAVAGTSWIPWKIQFNL